MAFLLERVAWRGAPAALYLGIVGVRYLTRGALLDGVGYLVLATLIAVQAALGQGPMFRGWWRVPIVVIIGLAVVAWLMWPVVAIRIAGLLVLVVVQVWGIVRSMKSEPAAGTFASVFYGVSTADPPVIVMAVADLMAASVCAAIVPAVRTARSDPARLLREV